MSWFLLSILPVLVRSLVRNAHTEDMGPLQLSAQHLPSGATPFLTAALTPTVTTCFPPLTPTRHLFQGPGRVSALEISLLSSPLPPSLPPLPCLFSILEVHSIFSEMHKTHSSWQAGSGASCIQGLPREEPRLSQADGLRALEGSELEAQLAAGCGDGGVGSPHL